MIIRDEALKRNLLSTLADEKATKILSCAIPKPKSVVDLITECGIPHTSAYRIVNELNKSGLLLIERIVITPEGKKHTLYRSTFSRITVTFERGNVEADVAPNSDIIDKAARLFYSLKPEEGER